MVDFTEGAGRLPNLVARWSIHLLSAISGNSGVYRIRPTGGPAERVVDLKGFHHTGYFSFWMGLDPDDNPLLLRDLGGDDIYALTLEPK